MEYLETLSKMTEEQFTFMAGQVRKVAESFLMIHFGERCETFELNCECCARYVAMDRMLTADPPYRTLEQEIVYLEEALAWRKTLIEHLKNHDRASMPTDSKS